MKQKVRVLIVDDSSFARLAIARQLQSDAEIEVIDFARDGIEALEKIPGLKPDVVTLDVEMPRMDGLTTLKQIMSVCPTPVVMLSTVTGNGMGSTLRALELGAVDFFLKPSLAIPAGVQGAINGLPAKVKMAANIGISKLLATIERKQNRIKAGGGRGNGDSPPRKIVVIGSSTGGPRALYEVIPALPADIPAAILVVQHMPPGFTRSLAERLDQISKVAVKEAAALDVLRRGEVIIAPGDYHMRVKRGGTIELNQEPQVCGVRPAVDVTMESVALVFGASTVGVVLTGMGADGTRGTSFIKAAGGKVIAEDESTCVVWGMPKSVAEAGNADRIVPLPRVASELTRMLNFQGGITKS